MTSVSDMQLWTYAFSYLFNSHPQVSFSTKAATALSGCLISDRVHPQFFNVFENQIYTLLIKFHTNHDFLCFLLLVSCSNQICLGQGARWPKYSAS